MKRRLLILLVAILLAGCVTPHWRVIQIDRHPIQPSTQEAIDRALAESAEASNAIVFPPTK